MAEYQLPFTGSEVENLLNIINALADWAKASEKPTYTAEEVGARPSTWMPTASDVGARPNTWTPSASDVGADPSGTAAGAVSSHNTAADAHEDIRSLIEQITTGKVSVSDIIDNLTTSVANKPQRHILELRQMVQAQTLSSRWTIQ